MHLAHPRAANTGFTVEATPGVAPPKPSVLAEALDLHTSKSIVQDLQEQVKVLTMLVVGLLEQVDGSFDLTRDELVNAQKVGFSITELHDLVRVQSDQRLSAGQFLYNKSDTNVHSIIAEAVVAAQMAQAGS